MNLNQITASSLDLTKSIPFYKNLGFNLKIEELPNYARFECPGGDSTFSLHQTNELPKGEGICIYFECEDLHEFVETLKQKGVQFDLGAGRLAGSHKKVMTLLKELKPHT